MKTPPFLQKSSVVRIVSTARKISPAEVAPAIQMLRSWGLEVQLGRNIYATDHQFGGNDQQRLEDLQEALNDPEVDMVWCSRGGYGTSRLLDQLGFTGLTSNPKWVVGYSDITNLLCHINKHCNLVTLHATMPINVKNQLSEADIKSVQSMQQCLFGKTVKYALNKHSLTREGDCKGQIVGGNLSILYSLLGSNSIPDCNESILFIEDLDEYLYHIDRMMVNIKRNGILDNLSGIVIGGMSDMNDNTVPFGKTAEEIIWEHVKDYDYPVYFGFSAGHVSPNLALPMGQEVEIENNTIRFF